MANNTLVTGYITNTPILQEIALSAAGDDKMLNTRSEISLFLQICKQKENELAKVNIKVTDLGNSKFTIEKTNDDESIGVINFDLNKNLLTETVEGGLLKGTTIYKDNIAETKFSWWDMVIGSNMTNIKTKNSKTNINYLNFMACFTCGLADFFTKASDKLINADI